MSELEPTITKLEPTATKRLRALLDERGVEWEDMSIRPYACTSWHDPDGEPCTALEGADDIPDGKLSAQALLTPEQAIAATLGSCNCSNSERTSDSDATAARQGDAVEVVRCRDCKFYTPESMTREERGFGVYEDVLEPGGCFNPERCSHGGDPFGEWYVVGIDTEPDGFCAWASRKESE